MYAKIKNWLRSDNTRFWLRWTAFLLLGAALVVLSSIFEEHFRQEKTFDNSLGLKLLVRALAGIGEALAIAAVIAVLVDEAAKRKLLKEFAEQVSEHIIGRLLPGGLREHILQYLTADFVRRKWKITYDLRLREEMKTSGLERHVELVTTSSYVMENRSPLDKSYTVAYEVVQKWFDNLKPPEIRSVIVKGRAVYAPNITSTAGGFVKLDSTKTKELVVKIPGHEDKQKPHRASIKLVSVEYLGDTFYTSFDALHPVVGPTFVTASYDAQKLEVALYLSVDSEAKPVPLGPGEREKKWLIDKPLLPGQGFLLRWRPK
jgi:hypothetical protein